MTWRTIGLSDMDNYDGHVLDYARAAVVALARETGIRLEPMIITITSQIPPASGLSSSAAVIVATLGAVSCYFGLNLSREKICAIAYSTEASELATGAGQMDFYSCALGSIIYLDCSNQPPQPLERFTPNMTLRPVVIDTRVRHSTKQSIFQKRQRLAREDPDLLLYVTETLSAVQGMREILLADRPCHDDICKYLFSNHESLRRYMGVSTDLIDECIGVCLDAGAAGAKLTGSGLGGCLFAFVNDAQAPELVNRLNGYPVDVFPTTLDFDGLVVANSGSCACPV